MESDQAFDVRIVFNNGTNVETTIEEFRSEDEIVEFLGGRPRWVRLGDVVLHTQNVVSIQSIYEEAA